MKNDEMKLFVKYIKKSKYYLEFGSGGSSIEASKYINNLVAWQMGTSKFSFAELKSVQVIYAGFVAWKS